MRSEAWRPAATACNRSPREAWDPALQALRPGCEELAVTDPAQMPAVAKLWRTCSRSAEASAEVDAGEASAAPEPKTATVERREASVPRHGTQGASQAPGVPRRKRVHARLSRNVARPTGAAAPERFSALRRCI